jgi:hypothetical protein
VLYSAPRPAMRSADSAVAHGLAPPAQSAALRNRAATPAAAWTAAGAFPDTAGVGGRIAGSGGATGAASSGAGAFGGGAVGGASGDSYTDRAQLYESIRQIARQGAGAAAPPAPAPPAAAAGGYAPGNRAPPRPDAARWSGAAAYAAAPPAAGVNIACV